MSDVSKNLLSVRERISVACVRGGRESSSVELVAVSKTFPANLVRDAIQAGQGHFAESRIQEAEPKIAALPRAVQWHFIGRVQRNKVRKLLLNFDVIHSIDSLILASYINEISSELGIYPKGFLQVNIGNEASKSGYEEKILRSDMESLLKLDRLKLIGLMCIPPAGPNAESARPWFAALREIRDKLENEFGVRFSALSMGMSGDFEVAIEEGATHVRVGSAIFGNRAYLVDGELG